MLSLSFLLVDHKKPKLQYVCHFRWAYPVCSRKSDHTLMLVNLSCFIQSTFLFQSYVTWRSRHYKFCNFDLFSGGLVSVAPAVYKTLLSVGLTGRYRVACVRNCQNPVHAQDCINLFKQTHRELPGKPKIILIRHTSAQDYKMRIFLCQNFKQVYLWQ